MLNQYYMLFLSIVLVFSLENKAYSQSLSNLDFEESYPNEFIPKHWHLYDFYGTGIKFSLDSSVFFEGNHSLKVDFEKTGRARLDCFLPSPELKGSEIYASLRIKEKGLFKIEIILQTIGGQQITNCSQGLIQNNDQEDWTLVNIPLIQIPEFSEDFFFRVKIKGQGIIWIDDIKIYLSGKLFQENSDTVQEPTQGEINWLQKQVLPISPYAPFDENTLENLRSMFMNTGIVGLGEITHGSGSVFKLKKKIIQFLVQEYNFQLITEEIPLPQSKDVSNFVLGRTETLPLDRAVNCWDLYSEEHFETLNWLKEYNKRKKEKIDYLGFDISIDLQGLDEIMEAINSYDQDEQIINNILTLKKGIFFARFKARSTCYHSNLSDEQKRYIEDCFLEVEQWIQQNIQDDGEKNWLLLNLNNSKQLYLVYQEGMLRDYFQAENVDAIFKTGRNIDRIIVSGHNAHVSKANLSMGEYLSERYGKKYVSVGFAFHEGKYSAFGSQRLNSYKAQVSYPGTFEYIFHLTGLDAFILDLRKISPSDPNASWLFKMLSFRKTGSTKSFGEFSPTSLMNEFDIIIFINKSRASNLKKATE